MLMATSMASSERRNALFDSQSKQMFGSLSFKLPETFLQILNWKSALSVKNMCQEACCLPGVFLPSPYKPWVQSRGSWHPTWSLCPRYTHIILGTRLEMILSPRHEIDSQCCRSWPRSFIRATVGGKQIRRIFKPFPAWMDAESGGMSIETAWNSN